MRNTYENCTALKELSAKIHKTYALKGVTDEIIGRLRVPTKIAAMAKFTTGLGGFTSAHQKTSH